MTIYDKILKDMTWYDQIWQYVEKYDKIWQDMEKYGKTELDDPKLPEDNQTYKMIPEKVERSTERIVTSLKKTDGRAMDIASFLQLWTEILCI